MANKSDATDATDLWESTIAAWLKEANGVTDGITITQVLISALKVDAGTSGMANRMRVANIMTRLGWTKGPRKWIDGASAYVYVRREEGPSLAEKANNMLSQQPSTIPAPQSSAVMSLDQEDIDELNGHIANLEDACGVMARHECQLRRELANAEGARNAVYGTIRRLRIFLAEKYDQATVAKAASVTP